MPTNTRFLATINDQEKIDHNNDPIMNLNVLQVLKHFDLAASRRINTRMLVIIMAADWPLTARLLYVRTIRITPLLQ